MPDRTGLASARGNVLVQARSLCAALRGLAAMRALVRSSQRLEAYLPRGRRADWDAAEARVYGR